MGHLATSRWVKDADPVIESGCWKEMRQGARKYCLTQITHGHKCADLGIETGTKSGKVHVVLLISEFGYTTTLKSTLTFGRAFKKLMQNMSAQASK